MKFRAVMVDPGPMRELTHIVNTISKLSKECVLRLSDEKIFFIVSEDNSGPTPPVLWCEISQSNFFSEYQMIGIDEDHKDIYLGVVSASFAKSLVTLKTAKMLKIKLTKKQCPCLTLDIEMPSSISQQTRQVSHDIPVVVVPRKLWGEFNEPKIPQPDISIELPPLKQLRNTIDRMKSMSSEIIISASAEGRLTLQIKTDTAKVSTRFRGLNVESFEGPIDHSDSETESQTCEDVSKICSCRIDAKKFSMFLNAEQISHNRTLCHIIHKRLVVLHLHTKENVNFQCFIMGIVY
ncbi:checkpoint protein HUS1 [Danaus plexippus]|uniref:checkpoint protein HUS1 n=1 Tax=Danaus plexippus TaxID=13037 RepID=UPI002AAF7F05|nr:checkpoint protein HUS1 [Danaus plexippus]